MDHAQHNQIVSFIWGIADDVLRDLYVRGKYGDVILPMTVLRRFDAVLEPTKQAVLDMKASLCRGCCLGSNGSNERDHPRSEERGLFFVVHFGAQEPQRATWACQCGDHPRHLLACPADDVGRRRREAGGRTIRVSL